MTSTTAQLFDEPTTHWIDQGNMDHYKRFPHFASYVVVYLIVNEYLLTQTKIVERVTGGNQYNMRPRE